VSLPDLLDGMGGVAGDLEVGFNGTSFDVVGRGRLSGDCFLAFWVLWVRVRAARLSRLVARGWIGFRQTDVEVAVDS